MVRLKRSLSSVDAFLAAVKGYEHLGADVLTAYLLKYYVVDLDLIPDFRRAIMRFKTAKDHTPTAPLAA
ncbi:MAG: hypothetical protein JJ902_18445 [Roseibium sp.]|nr:hypothetical protein [Roseibium sp.]